ncbi:MAG: hypothetical protein ACOY4A_10060 [Pseudomonadota bacterium]
MEAGAGGAHWRVRHAACHSTGITASDDPAPDGSWRNGVSGWIDGLLLQKRGDAQAGR